MIRRLLLLSVIGGVMLSTLAFASPTTQNLLVRLREVERRTGVLPAFQATYALTPVVLDSVWGISTDSTPWLSRNNVFTNVDLTGIDSVKATAVSVTRLRPTTLYTCAISGALTGADSISATAVQATRGIFTSMTFSSIDSTLATALSVTRLRPTTIYGATLSGNFLGGDSVGNVTAVQATRGRFGTIYGATLSGNFLGGDTIGNVTAVQATRMHAGSLYVGGGSALAKVVTSTGGDSLLFIVGTDTFYAVVHGL